MPVALRGLRYDQTETNPRRYDSQSPYDSRSRSRNQRTFCNAQNRDTLPASGNYHHTSTDYSNPFKCARHNQFPASGDYHHTSTDYSNSCKGARHNRWE